jgi:PilZ domain
MEQRCEPRVSPYKQLAVQVSTDTVCFTGMIRDISRTGSCISLRSENPLTIHKDNRVLIRCQLKEFNEIWADEIFIGRVRWIKDQAGETAIGVELLDTDEYYHPKVFSLHNADSD